MGGRFWTTTTDSAQSFSQNGDHHDSLRALP